jgi:4-amino-4-deoxy-L-arabinose transferase-like glycosyltransferase
MKRFTGSDWVLLILLALLTAFYVLGLPAVPFHPDESTQLYMSADFEQLLTNPFELAFNPNAQGDMKQHYRLIDAPLTRYLLGFGRTIGGFPALRTDWDWSKTWDENVQAGALPSEELLYTGRLAITSLLPLGLLFLYLAGKQVGDGMTGLWAALFLGLNALVLLHARRAMAEGALIFGVAFFLWSLFQGDRRAWLCGLAMAIAFNAKQSTLALLPVGLIAVAWLPSQASIDFKRVGVNIAQYLGVFVLLTFALNPVFWNDPVQTIQIAIHERQDLLERQLADTQRLAPEKVLNSPEERLVAVLANLYATPPMFYEVGNYVEEIQPAENEYLSIPGHNLFRGLAGGGIMLFITLFGFAASLLILRAIGDARRKPPEGLPVRYADQKPLPEPVSGSERYDETFGRSESGNLQTFSTLRNPSDRKRRAVVLVVLASAAQFSALLLAVPLPWQRYVIPLVPFAALWAGMGLADLISAGRTALPALPKQGGR